MNSGYSKQQGFSLIEVLVSAFVMAVGVLGVLSMQLSSLSNNRGALYRSQANFMAMDIIDRMRSNPAGVDAGRYNAIDTGVVTGATALKACITSANGCSTDDLAANDIIEWTNLFAPGVTPIPAATGSVTYSAATDEFTVTVLWSEVGWDSANTVQANLNRGFTTVVKL